jgi:hypothetical protein
VLAAGFLINLGATPSNILPYFTKVTNYFVIDIFWFFICVACVLVLIISKGWVSRVEIMPAPIPEIAELYPNYLPFT